MLFLNFTNVEELIFEDQALQRQLSPELYSIFEQWRLARRISFLRGIGKQAILDLLNNLGEDDLTVLEKYFNQSVVVEKLNYTIAKNLKVSLTENKACDALCKLDGYNYFSTWRDEEYLYLSFWR